MPILRRPVSAFVLPFRPSPSPMTTTQVAVTVVFLDRPLPGQITGWTFCSFRSSLSNDFCLGGSPPELSPSQAHWHSDGGLIVSSLAGLVSIQRPSCELSRLEDQTTPSMP